MVNGEFASLVNLLGFVLIFLGIHKFSLQLGLAIAIHLRSKIDC
ncbi:hypothetical protein SAMN05421593_3644 [Chryseobacterium culicis]|uniref:Uncharacterized protein n=1 Tax=Chryseobacterium culicis TaxID=680127 RepID=A0A1H6HTU0_CHRCI|nr:hypothetical protein SAMN05421593_3644 [Chryseobacterium culicis]